MKRKMIFILSIAVVAAAAVGATIAYFTSAQTATNTFTVGNVKIALTEPKWTAEGAADALEVYPGEALARDPMVTNTGTNPCVVRIKVTWPTLPQGVGPITFRTDYVSGKLGDNWLKDGDYFYYMVPLAPGAVTDALFDQVVIPTGLGNGDALTPYNIVVTAEAVQAQGIFSKYADMEDSISLTNPPANSSTIEFELVKQMFANCFV